LSTVRIYKVAELLNTTSQEVLALLKKAHGIELKSASSTLEEIVARQFVDRLAKQRLGAETRCVCGIGPAQVHVRWSTITDSLSSIASTTATSALKRRPERIRSLTAAASSS